MSFQSFYPGQAFYAGSYPPAPTPAASVKTAVQASTVKEKPTKRSCNVAGCTNGIVQGGLCVSHGAKRRQCKFPGCSKSSKSAGMCSKHGPKRAPCDEEGCSSISVRGTKCKVHAAPSKKCVIGGCRKGSVVGGMCKRHQDQFKTTNASRVLDTSAAPTTCMPVQASYPVSAMSHAMAQQSMLSGMEMGMNVGFPFAYPTMLAAPMMAPYRSPNYAFMGYEGGVCAPQLRTLDSLASDALMMLELAKRSRQYSTNEAIPSKKSLKHLSSP